MAKVSALKTGKANGPPTADAAPGNLDNPPREKTEPKGRLELKIPISMIESFEAEAAKRFGFKKGSKSLMFEELWRSFSKTIS